MRDGVAAAGCADDRALGGATRERRPAPALARLAGVAATRAGERPHLVAVAALAAGLAAAPGGSRVAVAAACAGAVALAAGGAWRAAGLWLALLAAGALAGGWRLDAIDAPGRQLRPGDGVAGVATLLERPRSSAFGTRAVLRLESGRGRGARLLALAPRGLRWPAPAEPGARVRVRGHVRAPPASERFDMRAHLRRRGVAHALSLAAAEPGGAPRGGLAGALDSARRRAEAGIAAGLPPERAALARGMVLGQDEAIDEATRADFRDAGLGHLLAVSGQNVALLCALALAPLALAGAGPALRASCLVALVAVYVPLAGAGPSLQRAGAMGIAALVALGAGRARSRAYALALAAVATLALNPRAAGEPGWQLSFAAVAGIAVAARPLARAFAAAAREVHPVRWRSWAAAAGGWVADGAAMTVAATVATAPLVAHHFGEVPLAALPANVLALPAVAPAMWLAMAAGAAGQLTALPPLAPAAEAACSALGAAAGPPLAYVAEVARRSSELADPLGVRLPATGVALTYAGLLALGALAARRLRGAGAALAAAGSSWRADPARRRLALAGVALATASVAGAAAAGDRPALATVRFLDVGQGDATLVQHPGGAAILFDGGPPEARVARLLRRAGVRRLSAVVATHASRDHHGGLREVLRRFPVGVLVDGGDGTRDPEFRALLAEAARRRVARVPARSGLVLRAGGLRVDVLGPPPRPPGPPPEDPNPRAVVALVTGGDLRLLLSGDAESGALLPLALPDVDAMKVPHHGSADDGLPAVLARARPEVAAIQVGRDNPYGHPAPSTLAALAAAVPHVARTDRDGTVTLTAGPSGLRLRTER